MRRVSALLAAVMLTCCMTALTVSAKTAEDVAEKARELGIPESQVQAAYNDMTAGEHDEAWYDAVCEQLEENLEEVRLQLAELYGVPDEETPAQPQDDGTALYALDGTPAERVSEETFISMSYEEMQAYIASLDDASKQRFMNSLTARERNAMAKALPASEQAGLADLMVKAADTLGMQVTVDHIGSDQINMTVRDGDGMVIDRTAFGTSVDATGISHTVPFVTAACAAVLSLAGFGLLAGRNRKAD